MRRYKLFAIALIILFQICEGSMRVQQTETIVTGIQIIDARLGTDVKERMIVGEDSTFALNSKVFLWFKVVGATSETLTVTWNHGDLYFSTMLAVGGSPWRTWANKLVVKPGEWSVMITDSKENVLKKINFNVE